MADNLYLKFPREYGAWAKAKKRCRNKTDPQYSDYGGRGIQFCDSWDRFKDFFLDMGAQPSIKHTLDRIDNNKGYFKENCRWATPHVQSRNKRSNILITYNGQTKCSFDWSLEFGMGKTYISASLRRGKTFPEIIKRIQEYKKGVWFWD